MEQTENDNCPEWLQVLENHNQKPKLAHEIGAGAPCIKCNEQCPGLDLHFWRKICKICKCHRDDHDVPDDKFAQFNLLFSSINKVKISPIVLKINQRTDNAETFVWIPPNTSEELAADYMKALPVNKLPIKGSAGAAFRKQQLQKQLPLHDFDHKACDELSDVEQKEFKNYVENLKKFAGQGSVSKLTNSNPVPIRYDKLGNPTIMTSINDNQQPGRYHHVIAKHNINGTVINSDNVPTKPREFLHSNNKNHIPLNINQSNIIPNSGLTTNNTKPASAQLINYRNPENTTISSIPRNNPIFPEEAVGKPGIYENLNLKPDNLQSAMDNLSMNCNSLNCQQCKGQINTGDVVVTAKQIRDAAWHPGCFTCSVCNELLADLIYFCYKDQLYCARDLAQLLNIPRCYACDELIFLRKYTVAEGHNYHVKHFCCWDCDIPLAGKQYISENNRPLCLPCYQKNYAKSCNMCKKIISADQKGVVVKNLDFHATDECFCCAFCKKSLLNGKIAVKENQLLCSRECISKYFNSMK